MSELSPKRNNLLSINKYTHTHIYSRYTCRVPRVACNMSAATTRRTTTRRRTRKTNYCKWTRVWFRKNKIKKCQHLIKPQTKRAGPCCKHTHTDTTLLPPCPMPHAPELKQDSNGCSQSARGALSWTASEPNSSELPELVCGRGEWEREGKGELARDLMESSSILQDIEVGEGCALFIMKLTNELVPSSITQLAFIALP